MAVALYDSNIPEKTTVMNYLVPAYCSIGLQVDAPLNCSHITALAFLRASQVVSTFNVTQALPCISRLLSGTVILYVVGF